VDVPEKLKYSVYDNEEDSKNTIMKKRSIVDVLKKLKYSVYDNEDDNDNKKIAIENELILKETPKTKQVFCPMCDKFCFIEETRYIKVMSDYFGQIYHVGIHKEHKLILSQFELHIHYMQFCNKCIDNRNKFCIYCKTNVKSDNHDMCDECYATWKGINSIKSFDPIKFSM